jgi:DNA-binding LacI/PurR family transcriptional regulator
MSVRIIAKEAGVSITTVSRALNNDSAVSTETQQRVLAIANRRGYVATMGRRVTTLIGFAYTGAQALSHPFDAAVLEGLADGVSEYRFDVVVLNLQRDKSPDETYTQFFMRKGVRGIVLRTMGDSRDACQAIADERFPSFVISERFDSPNINCIDCDSKPDSMRATEYLIGLGHRDIAFAMHNVHDRDHLDRFEGYQDALKKHGIKTREALIFRHPYTLAGGATVMKMAMSMPARPTAIYVADPMMAVGAVKEAHEMGVRIPDDVSIVGFDDTNMRYSVHPTLTAVCQDARALGFEAARHLTRMLSKTEDRDVRLQKTLPTFFEVHQSTAPPPEGLAPSRSNGRKRA